MDIHVTGTRNVLNDYNKNCANLLMISDTPTLHFKSPRKKKLMAKAFNQFYLCSTYAKNGFFSVISATFLSQLIFVFTFTNIFGFFSWTEFGPSILGVQ